MKKNIKLIASFVTISALSSLLGACGGDSKSSSSDSFAGNWSSMCYSQQPLQTAAKEMKIEINSSTKGLKVMMNNTEKQTTTSAVGYSDANCTNLLRKFSYETCNYNLQGTKVASGGKTVQKIDTKCGDGKIHKDIILIQNNSLYMSIGSEKDAQGYPTTILYDYYLTRQ